jgi:cell shape-determining protein MreD
MLGISIASNALSTHGACTVVFVAIAAIVAFSLSSIQTLGRLTSIVWIGLACMLIASKSFHSQLSLGI